MYLTMNRFRIRPGSEAEFEAIWKGRETKLPQVPGFVSFHLMKGPASGEAVLYASHTMWRSEADFVAWTKSEAFRAAHARAGEAEKAEGAGGMYLGPPQLECFETVQSIG